MHLNPKQKDAIIHKLGDATVKEFPSQTTTNLSNHFLNKLIHVAGHDLRSPMFVIRSYSQLLQRTQEKERLEKGLKLISDATVTMEKTLTSFVQLIDIYTNPVPTTENLFFNEIFERVKIQLYNEIKEFQPKFIVDFQTCQEVQFPSDFLKEIMLNLFDNSMRHNSERKDLLIKVCTYKEGNRTVLEIADNGNGIEEEKELENIMQPFYSVSDDSNCAGIGLSKVQAIAKVCNGLFEIESSHGFGMKCKFYF